MNQKYENKNAETIKRRDLVKCLGAGLLSGAALSPTASAATSQGPQLYPILLTTVWVHGTIVQVESPENLLDGGVIRRGWGTTFQGRSGSTNWFHIPFTTPGLTDNVPKQLDKVSILYKTTDAHITNLHVYDGLERIRAFDNLYLSGDHSMWSDWANTWVISPRQTIKYGLGLSVGVKFATCFEASNCSPLEFLFTAAGAEFYRT